MAKKTELTLELARDIARACGKDRFERKGYDAKFNAQSNLTGRTHYADDSTLKFFHARINSCRVAHEGLVFAMVESVAEDMNNSRRGFRFVAFDIFGAVINDRSSTDSLHRKSDKAISDMLTFLESFDVLAHYKDAIGDIADRLKRQAADMAAMCRRIKV